MRTLLSLSCLLVACASTPSNDAAGGIGYGSVHGAFEALKLKPGTQLSRRGGWTLIRDDEARTTWSFASEDHPAHPAVTKVSPVVKDGRNIIDLRIKCEASKDQC